MRMITTTFVVARFVSVPALLICMFLDVTAERRHDSDLSLNIAVGCCLTAAVILLGVISSASGWLSLGLWCNLGACALGVAALSVGGLWSDLSRLWAEGVFVTGFALLVLGFWMDWRVAEPETWNASTHEPETGWALIFMLFGVVALVVGIKCLVFGPQPYSPLAYVSGPCLFVLGYLVDPDTILHLGKAHAKQQAERDTIET
jgi:hypothetical protein